MIESVRGFKVPVFCSFVRTSSPRSHFAIFRAAKGLCCPPRTKPVKAEHSRAMMQSAWQSSVYVALLFHALHLCLLPFWIKLCWIKAEA